MKLTVISIAWPFSLMLVRQNPTKADELRGVGEGVGVGLVHASRRSSVGGWVLVLSVEADIVQ